MSMPTKQSILAFWRTEGSLTVPSSTNICWSCEAQTSSLERCHIIPRSKGGTELPSNLVLLCRRCHHEAPSVSFSKDPMLSWIRNRDERNYCNLEKHLKALQTIPSHLLKTIAEDPIKYELMLGTVSLLLEENAELHNGELAQSTVIAIVNEAARRIAA